MTTNPAFEATVNRNHPSNKGSFSEKHHSEPESGLGADQNRYVAPDRASLHKQVRYHGVVMTYGELLEQLQPVGVRRTLTGETKRPTWGAVHPDDNAVCTEITEQVALDSGLEDLTTEIDRVRDDLAVANRMYHEATYVRPSFGFAPGPSDELREKVTALDTLHRQLLREQAAEELSAMEGMELIRWMDAQSAGKTAEVTRARAEALAENDHIYVVRALAGDTVWRRHLGEEYRRELRTHEDETVRANYDNNPVVPAHILASIAGDDFDPAVGEAAH